MTPTRSITFFRCQVSARFLFIFIALICLAVLAVGLFLQTVRGLHPCSLCILQRYAWALVGLTAGLGCLVSMSPLNRPKLLGWFLGFQGVWALAGLMVAARQSWLQWFPPEFASCGRDWDELLNDFPLSRALPLIFQGSGDCTRVEWTFLGGSIANWSALGLAILFGLSVLGVLQTSRTSRASKVQHQQAVL
jgi:disulfide bond formation protein DsbB